MNERNHKRKAETLAERVKKIYHMIGGSFLFMWVYDVSTCTYSLAATDHFAKNVAGQMTEPFRDFFHAAMENHAINSSDINWWPFAFFYKIPPRKRRAATAQQQRVILQVFPETTWSKVDRK